MSAITFLRKLLAKGMDLETALETAEAFEESIPTGADLLTARQARNKRYYETQRLKASESKTIKTIKTVSDAFKTPPRAHVRDITSNLDISGKITSEAKASSVYCPFLDFWAAYPLKVGKPKARLAYDSALKRIAEPDPPAVILTGLERLAPTWLDPAYIPHPTTWLNRDGWNDQPRPQRLPNERPDQPSAKLLARQANHLRAVRGAEILARSGSFD